MPKDIGKALGILASIAAIIGTCVAIIALIPAMGQWIATLDDTPSTVEVFPTITNAVETSISSISTVLPSATSIISFTEQPALINTILPDSTASSTNTEIQLPSPTLFETPTIIPTLADRHPGEINLLEANAPLPTDWTANGQYTYWEGFIRVQDEPFIDFTIGDCGDDEGNYRLDKVQIFDPDGNVVVNERNCNGNLKLRVRTYQLPGYYRIFIQDNDTGRRNGNSGELSIDMLRDQTIYKDIP